MNKKKILVVGAGFSGAVIARQLADRGHRVTVIDKKNHVAGHAFDYVNDLGIRVHQYGPHIFHTNNHKVVEWLSRFTEWIPYQHKVKAMIAGGRLVTLPVNLETKRLVGQENLLDIFVRPYTRKMWNKELEDLDPGIANRVPFRDDMNDLYFPNDSFQALPKYGYEKLIKAILDHPDIDLKLNTAYQAVFSDAYSYTFNSMPIDEYFDFKFGHLPYRSVKFHSYDIPIPRIFPVSQVNFTHDGPLTRLTEWKNFPGHGDHPYMSTITFEEPCDYLENKMERYYPVKDSSGVNASLYKRYKRLIPRNMTFIGRCGMYVYIDMHQAVSSALAISDEFHHKNGT